MKPIDKGHFRTPLLPTPFAERTRPLSKLGSYIPWAGYLTVNIYEEEETEYFALRNQASLYDLTPMVKYRIEGPDAEDFLNRLTVRNVTKQKPGRVVYTIWCDDDGKVIDDGTIFRLTPTRFRLCCQERHLPWLLDSAIGFQVEIEEETDDIAALSLQGPTSFSVLKRAGFKGVETLKPFDLREFSLANGATVLISRTGFTGDLGYELWTDVDNALPLWDILWEAGPLYGLRAVGSHALNMARIEAGFIQTNGDFIAANQAVRRDRPRSPFEIGLEWMLSFDKGHFNGRRALLAEKERGTSRFCLVGLEIEGNVAADHSLIYHKKSKEVGHITAALWSPTAKRNIAIATLKRPYGVKVVDDLWVEIYAMRELEWQKLMLRAWIVPRPFFDPPRKKVTPPGRF
ncbi:aminomethyltransferase [Rhodoligotrophos appendicifer]|uniref:aminomethyltransferase family protein n=1 Tax=Rhodoligotrophos appendicifer TaxID=987056 RepID=UPI001180FE9D|nr:aminomethyltransferase family protein [Rhodoligotrophos appendicifer]